MTGNKHAYFGAQFMDSVSEINQSERMIFAYTYGGAAHLWKRNINDESSTWKSELTIKGHFGEVSDLAWDPDQ